MNARFGSSCWCCRPSLRSRPRSDGRVVDSFNEGIEGAIALGGIFALYVLALGYVYVGATMIVRSLLPGLGDSEQSLPRYE